MQTLRRTILLVLPALVCALIGVSQTTSGQEITTVDQAFDHLFSKDSLWPDGLHPKDGESIEFVKKHLPEAKLIFTERFLAKKFTQYQGVRVLTMINDEKQVLEIVREVVQHYQYGDLKTPFIGGIATRGDERDMERLKAIIVENPEAKYAADVADLMVENGNAQAHAVLAQLKDFPGRWRQGWGVEKFLSKIGTATDSKITATPTPTAPVEQLKNASTTTGAVQSPARNGDDLAASQQNRWWPWAVGGVLMLAFVVFLFRKPK